jgi:hypothetical protein
MTGRDLLRRAAGLLAGVLTAAAIAAAAQAAEFFASIEDLPLPSGFAELEADGMVFESPAGRIVSAVARGSGSVEGVRTFYRGALPPLGWEARSGDRYRRDDEQLSFTFEPAQGGVLIVRVRLVPGNEE